MSAPRPSTPKSERTLRAILDAAEIEFAERGFDAARLGSVADAVGIRRASIVYYFRDKRALYAGVLDDVFGGLLEAVEQALAEPGPAAERIEAAISVWVDYVGARPSVARLLLREVAGATPGADPPLRAHLAPFFPVIARFVEERARGELRTPTPIDPAHVAATIAGATVFFVSALPALVPEVGNTLAPATLEEHRTQVLRIARRLLGIAGGSSLVPLDGNKGI